MAEIHTVTTLRSKRAEIERAISNYEIQLARALSDLASVEATLAIFEASGGRKSLPAYINLRPLFRAGELMALCTAALRKGPMTTRQMALHVMVAKEMNVADAVLVKAIASRLINALGQYRRKGVIIGVGEPKSPLTWRLSPQPIP